MAVTKEEKKKRERKQLLSLLVATTKQTMATNHSIQMEEYAFHPIRLCSEAGCTNLVDKGGGLNCLSHSRKSSGPLKKRPYRFLSLVVDEEGGASRKNSGAKIARRGKLCSQEGCTSKLRIKVFASNMEQNKSFVVMKDALTKLGKEEFVKGMVPRKRCVATKDALSMLRKEECATDMVQRKRSVVIMDAPTKLGKEDVLQTWC